MDLHVIHFLQFRQMLHFFREHRKHTLMHSIQRYRLLLCRYAMFVMYVSSQRVETEMVLVTNGSREWLQ
jgi:hypothetical protein